MRPIPENLQAALDDGITTHCRAWTITRTDGIRLGFTDHDKPLEIDGLMHEAASGFTATTVEQATGLSVDTHTIAGALQSAAITDLDVERGLFDGAEILHWLVDWQNVESRILLSRGRIGEVRRGRVAFEAEVVGLAERLNQPSGRALLASCDLRLGEPACGVNLASPAYRGTGVVVSVPSALEIAVDGIAGYALGWFERGRLTWTSGPNMAEPARIRGHRRAGSAVVLDLWQAPASEIFTGDAFEVTAGCDKRLATCRDKFSNVANFRGFPLIPGDDWAATYPKSTEVHDGGSLFRR